jgi:hypothetical protein
MVALKAIALAAFHHLCSVFETANFDHTRRLGAAQNQSWEVYGLDAGAVQRAIADGSEKLRQVAAIVL